MRAFIKQVELDSIKKVNDRESQKTKSISTQFEAKYLSTGFERYTGYTTILKGIFLLPTSLDELLSGGFQFHQIVEICGESDADEMNVRKTKQSCIEHKPTLLPTLVYISNSFNLHRCFFKRQHFHF